MKDDISISWKLIHRKPYAKLVMVIKPIWFLQKKGMAGPIAGTSEICKSPC
jgi:hypothetical protein